MLPTKPNNSILSVLGAIPSIIVGTLLAASFFQTCFSERILASNFVHPKTWIALMSNGQGLAKDGPFPDSISISFVSVVLRCAFVAIVAWLVGSALLVWRRKIGWIDALAQWGWYGWLWWSVLDVWEWLRVAASITGYSSAQILLNATPQLWLAGCAACWLTTALTLGRSFDSVKYSDSSSLGTKWLWLLSSLYIVTYTTMNWRLYFNLLVPHGDSVMYEEHLWNLMNGKGFRSYLDQGLFFGEHIQFVHLFLMPLYAIWPSHLLLEACSSTALACGAIPVFWMIRRTTHSDRTAFAAAAAYLLYFPMQFLDIEIDLKTFRPESFGIPLLLLTLDQLERKNMMGTLVGIGFCLTVKEDYAIILGPLGVWIAFSNYRFSCQQTAQRSCLSPLENVRTRILFGSCLSIFSVAYLWLATRVVMPWFRSGVEVHYASYFARFGKTPEQILRTMVTQPWLVMDALITTETTLYAIALLAPLAFLPIFAPERLAVGLPLFGILCLNELDGSRTPQHQFHAPLVAIVFWSLAAALPRVLDLIGIAMRSSGLNKRIDEYSSTIFVRNLLWTSSLATGLFFSLGPLGLMFWDSNSSWCWHRLYAPSHRAAMFARIDKLIPSTARVASTDFVHPRYTHHERSYDYSNYQRKVSGEGKRIPDDTEYLVIDTDHRYSTIKLPKEVPELRDEPDQWELLPNDTEGYFIVLKRKKG